MADVHWYDDIVMPALLGAARKGYGQAMHAALDAAGFDDMPRLGIRVVGGIARNGPLGPDVAAQLGVRGDRAERLVAALVERDYITADGNTYVLTDRGTAAAAATARAVDAFEAQVRTRVGDGDLGRARATLAVMVELSDPHFA